MANIIDTVHMAFISIVVCHCKSTKPINDTSTSTLFITYFYITEYLVRIKINHVCGWPIIFHLLIWLFYLLYCNITSLTTPIITIALLFITYFFAKWNFVFTLINSGPAKTRPARPLPVPLILQSCFLNFLILCYCEVKMI